MVFGLCLVGVALLVLLGCCLFCFLSLFDSAWWNRGIAEEVTMASNGKAVTGTAVMARSANEEKKKAAEYIPAQESPSGAREPPNLEAPLQFAPTGPWIH